MANPLPHIFQQLSVQGPMSYLDDNFNALIGNVQSGAYMLAQDTGTVNAYAMTLSPAPTALTPSMIVTLQNISADNTGPSTLNINGLGAKNIYTVMGNNLSPADLLAGQSAQFMLRADGAAWVLLSLQPSQSYDYALSVFTNASRFVTPSMLSYAFSRNSDASDASTYQVFPDGNAIQVISTFDGTNVAANATSTQNVVFPISFKSSATVYSVASNRNGFACSMVGASRWPTGETVLSRNITGATAAVGSYQVIAWGRVA